jgi:hypothetical protein
MSLQFKDVSTIDDGWKKGAKVSTIIDFDDDEGDDAPIMPFSWFTVKHGTEDTAQEEKETREAIHFQIQNNIIKPNGMPVGLPDPPPPKMNKWEKKRQRLINRQIEKDMAKKGK